MHYSQNPLDTMYITGGSVTCDLCSETLNTPKTPFLSDFVLVANQHASECYAQQRSSTREHATVREFVSFCFCPTPDLDENDVCRHCGSRWEVKS